MKFIKENLRVVIAVLIAVILIITGVIILVTQEENSKDDNKEQENIKEQISEITGMTGEDAIDIVKKNFHSYIYEYAVEVTKDSLYKVIVENTYDKSEIVYYVDPNTGNSYIDIDTK